MTENSFNKKEKNFRSKTVLIYNCILAVGVEDRILDRKGLQDLADLPPMDQLLSQTAAILKTPIQKTHQLLGSNLQTLSSNLDQYVKDQSPSSEEK